MKRYKIDTVFQCKQKTVWLSLKSSNDRESSKTIPVLRSLHMLWTKDMEKSIIQVERNRYFRLMDTRNCGWQAQGIQFILIRTAEASGLQGGERKSRLAVTAYPFLMEVYRLSSAEATVTITCHQEAWSLSVCMSVCVCLYAWTYQFLFSLVCHFLFSIIHSGLLILH